MSITLKSLGLSSLPMEQKLKVVGNLWDEILSEPSSEGILTPLKQEELKRRIKLAQDHPDDYILWEDAVSETLKRIDQ